MKVIRFLQVWCNAILNTIKIFSFFCLWRKRKWKIRSLHCCIIYGKVKTASISSNASQSIYSFLKAIYEFKIKQRKLNNGDRWKNISDEENWIIESDPLLSISSAKIGKWNWNKYITLHPEVRSKACYSLFVYSAREIDIEKRGKKGTFTFSTAVYFLILG